MYHTIPDIIISRSILRKADPETTHIPVKKSADMRITAVFLLSFDENENRIARI